MKTLRLLLFWECNLTCSYCCNEIPEIREGILPIKKEEIDFTKYDNVCLSGGEPFLQPELVFEMLSIIPNDVYIYTNGIKINKDIEEKLSNFKNLKGLNIGLHYPKTFNKLIGKLNNNPLVRFHVEDIYENKLKNEFPHSTFKFWKRNDCEMSNEDIRILTL